MLCLKDLFLLFLISFTEKYTTYSHLKQSACWKKKAMKTLRGGKNLRIVYHREEIVFCNAENVSVSVVGLKCRGKPDSNVMRFVIEEFYVDMQCGKLRYEFT